MRGRDETDKKSFSDGRLRDGGGSGRGGRGEDRGDARPEPVYGDVGYSVFRVFTDRAELTLRQDDFFFNRDWPKPRPKSWLARVEAHRNAKIVFPYEKPGNFYGKK